MHPRNLVFITLLALCHLQLRAQALTSGFPPSSQNADSVSQATDSASSSLPEDPGQEVLPLAQPEPTPSAGVPVDWKADRQTWAGDTATLYGVEEFHYRGYVLRADKVVYNRTTTELVAEGHLQVAGGPEDVLIEASHGDMRLNMHTARFYNVRGSIGVRRAGHTAVFSTANSFVFSGRVLLETGEGRYRIVDGRMTNCRLPKPDWELISRSIDVADGKASTTNTFFKFLGVPIFYLPYLRHPVDTNGRESGLMIPIVSNGSSIRGYTFGEQVYIVLNRSMDMVVGSEYYSRRGFAPNGDFRYKGPGQDHLIIRWNALLDRGVEEPNTTTSTNRNPPITGHAAANPDNMVVVNQGGVDINAAGRKDLSPETRIAGNVEFLSNYVYRLVFNDNYQQAVNSQVQSQISYTHEHNGLIASGALERFQTFASTNPGDEVRILHMPGLRYDVLDRPLGTSPLYWGMSSSLSHLGRSESNYYVRNLGRFDFYPHLTLPIEAGGWNIVPQIALRETFYTGSQIPDLTGATPQISHEALNRADGEASVDVRPPALERNFTLGRWNRTLRHVVEPELMYRFVGGIGSQTRRVTQIDTTDIATDTNEAGYSLTQHFYLRPNGPQPCSNKDATESGSCSEKPREWASWQIAQKFFIDRKFGGAVAPNLSSTKLGSVPTFNQRYVFDTTLDLSGIAFLTGPRNISPVISRLRFEAVDNLRAEWDVDYDPKAGRLSADNLYAGYSWGRTTVGLGHSLLNAVDESTTGATLIQSQQLQPFVYIGKPGSNGFNLAADGGYDFVHGLLQYGGVQAGYNWNCCGISIGYRRFELGTVGTVGRDETQWLYSFTLANFGSVGDIRRSNTVYRDPTLPPAY